jgi:hypothetical protein
MHGYTVFAWGTLSTDLANISSANTYKNPILSFHIYADKQRERERGKEKKMKGEREGGGLERDVLITEFLISERGASLTFFPPSQQTVLQNFFLCRRREESKLDRSFLSKLCNI